MTAAATVRGTFRPFGASVEIVTDDDRVLAGCSPAVAGFPADAGVEFRCRIEITTTHDGPDDPAWPVTSTAWDGTTMELRCGSGVMYADSSTATASGTMPRSLLAIPDAVRIWVEGAVSALLIGGGHLHAVHAALVEHAGRGLLLRGPSGAGKSTLTYACLRAGFRVASDDWVYGVAGRPADRLIGYPWRMFLVGETTRFFPELAAVAPVPHPGSDRIKLPIEPLGEARITDHRVDALVLLDPSPELSLTVASPGEAAERFWAPSLPTERTDLPAAFVDELLDRPCYVLRRGTDPVAAAAVLRDLAERL